MHIRIFRMIATSGFDLTALECIKFVLSCDSAEDPAGGAYSAPRSPIWFKGPYFQEKERGGREKEKK